MCLDCHHVKYLKDEEELLLVLLLSSTREVLLLVVVGSSFNLVCINASSGGGVEIGEMLLIHDG